MARKPLIRWRRSSSRTRKFKLLQIHARRQARELIKENGFVGVYRHSLDSINHLYRDRHFSEFDRDLQSYRIPWHLLGHKFIGKSDVATLASTEYMLARAFTLAQYIQGKKKIPAQAFLDSFRDFSIATEYVEGSSFPFMEFFHHGEKVFGDHKQVDLYNTPFRVQEVLDGLNEGIRILSAYEESQVGFRRKLLMDAVRLILLKERKNFEKKEGLGDEHPN